MQLIAASLEVPASDAADFVRKNASFQRLKSGGVACKCRRAVLVNPYRFNQNTTPHPLEGEMPLSPTINPIMCFLTAHIPTL